jgi:hypothetical protein
MRHVFSLLAALLFGLLAAAASFAQDMETKVIVPDGPSGGVLVRGCYRITERLYGPYRMEFCLERRGNYTVTGGGVTCNGRLDWSARGRDISIDLRRTSCGKGVAWSADSLECRATGLFGGFGGGKSDGPSVQVIVPDRPGLPNIPFLGSLRCKYDPSEKGYKTVNVVARRIN